MVGPMSRTLIASSLLSLLAVVLVGPADESPSHDFVGRYGTYAVAADHAAASAAGAEILAAGGTAADAAAATMLALGVASPASSGLGGGGFALYYEASTGELTFLDFRERAPGAATPDMYEDKEPSVDGPANAPSQVGGLASGVPGEPAGVAALVSRFGKLPLSQVVAPAVRLAREGIEVNEHIARMSGYFGAQMKRDQTMAGWFPPGADAIPSGHRIQQPALARTLEALGRGGANAIYRGAIARRIAQANRAAGGIMTVEDLAAYEVVDREPLQGEHLGHRWVTAPPPSAGGYTLLQSLALLDRLPARWRAPGAPLLHALAETWKGPFLDRERYFGDPDQVALPIDAMMAAPRRDARAQAFHPALAMPPADYDFPLEPPQPVVQPEDHGTSHLCVVDAAGNIASVTTTVNLPFGARYTAAGMVMNDEMDDFARAVGEANAFGLIGGARNLPAPGKRPVSTMSPTIVFRGDQPVLCVGAAGGSRIVTATQQVAMNAAVQGMDLGDAMAAPRIHHQGHPNVLRWEEDAPLREEILSSLRARGHILESVGHVATVQAIAIEGDGERRRLVAASDPRKGGQPAGE